MKNPGLKIVSITTLIGLSLTLTSCFGPSEVQKRKEAQGSSQIVNSLEKQNLEKKRSKEEDPNKTRYLYLYSFGTPVGYYVTRGKISSNGSQIGPETEVVYSNSTGYTLDSAKDDGTYGAGDPGIFFFLADGTMIETNFDYIQSDQPIPMLNVPRLYK
ncbi:hypothetical protein PP914_gp121 [Arthrobacter phage Qui]|jgi:hypothetical protein|uniref:Lipoprotein n=1 Tax=Arthrobacter phage Qui TaxID=2603260 RepID=A0A5B8WFN4_9CAUD|nr:hypothetical protein PP914_gp121 [Arthrobacter phage Qui]QED11610.1 hypothetical protein SEA_QUI_121 [Arthrobacter phage Qui]QOC56442.1 hypothetical protein SEA_PAELLA_121 [Arthrobacter phage Paella]